MRKRLLSMFCFCLLPPAVMAEEEPAAHSAAASEQHAEEASHGDSEAHGEEHEAHHHKNEVALMLGGTYESEEGETFFTIGAEYARVLNPWVTTSYVAEYLDDVDAWVFIAPFHIHPWKNSNFFVALGPGFEHTSRRGHGESHGGEHGGEHGAALAEEPEPIEPEESENLFLWRTGIGYNFHVGKRLVIAPGLDLDLVREGGEWVEAWVFDVAIGYGF